MSTMHYSSEVRFAVVMYGGVSLAIYINGVANELHELCCATPLQAGDAPAPASTREVYADLARLLAAEPDERASYLAMDEAARRAWRAQGGEAQRFVVDVIAGTSAGGINGLFLAKALTQGERFDALKRLWIEEGDIGLLLNDSASLAGLPLRLQEHPQSLLNSDRMYLKLQQAMEGMERVRAPLVDQIECAITTTDIEGAPVPLRLFDRTVHERRHRHVYRFNQMADFSAEQIPFLAFAARCTSSFPFAFEPMCVEDARRLNAGRPAGAVSYWQQYRERHFGYLTSLEPDDPRWRARAYGDGGYLDNKPFGHAVARLATRMGGLPMERKLIYVEPAPSHPEQEAQKGRKPNALENAVAALTHIPQYETIREDLEAVLQRNRRVERVERLVHSIELDMEAAAARDGLPFSRVRLVDGQLRPWGELDLLDMADYHGLAFLPYRRLRVQTASEALADRLAQRWRVDAEQPHLLYALRALVRAWREAQYSDRRRPDRPTTNQFLLDHDLSYRLRRTHFLLRKVHQLVRLARRRSLLTVPVDQAPGPMRPLRTRLERLRGGVALDGERLLAAALSLRDGLAAALRQLRELDRRLLEIAPLGPAPGLEARRTLDALLRALLGEAPAAGALPEAQWMHELLSKELPPPDPVHTLQDNMFRRAQVLLNAAQAQQPPHPLTAALLADIEALKLARVDGNTHAAMNEVDRLLGMPRLVPRAVDGLTRVEIAMQREPDGEPALMSHEGRVARMLLAEYQSRFDEFDQVAFPLYFDTDTGEPSTVEVVRISPEDAPSLIDEGNSPRRKLAGTALFNFGGFLDAQWRRNDILWGRLDGAERLLAALLPRTDDRALREQMLARAQRAILREEMGQGGYGELVDRFLAALASLKEDSLQRAFKRLWSQLGDTPEDRHSRIGQALRAVLDDEGLRLWARDHYQVNRELAPQHLAQVAARAMNVTGQVLQGIEGQASAGGRWLVRAGRALHGLVSLATPGSFGELLGRHWLALLYAIELVLLGGGLLTGSESVRSVATLLLALTFGAHVLLLLTGDLLRKRRGSLWAALGGLVLGLVLLAGVGAWGLATQNWRQPLQCAVDPDHAVCQSAAKRPSGSPANKT